MNLEPSRHFIADPLGRNVTIMSTHQRLGHMGVSGELNAAYDILNDAGFANQQRVDLLVAAERSGHDVQEFARHLVKLCRAAQRQA